MGRGRISAELALLRTQPFHLYVPPMVTSGNQTMRSYQYLTLYQDNSSQSSNKFLTSQDH